MERCESGRIGLTANELTWETGSEGSNPSLSAQQFGYSGLLAEGDSAALFNHSGVSLPLFLCAN